MLVKTGLASLIVSLVIIVVYWAILVTHLIGNDTRMSTACPDNKKPYVSFGKDELILECLQPESDSSK